MSDYWIDGPVLHVYRDSKGIVRKVVACQDESEVEIPVTGVKFDYQPTGPGTATIELHAFRVKVHDEQ